MTQTVVKRDGRIVGFCEKKIMAAIKKAMTTTEHNVVDDLFAGCGDFVLKTPKKKSAGRADRGLSASEFIAMQTEKNIIEDINLEKVKDFGSVHIDSSYTGVVGIYGCNFNNR